MKNISKSKVLSFFHPDERKEAAFHPGKKVEFMREKVVNARIAFVRYESILCFFSLNINCILKSLIFNYVCLHDTDKAIYITKFSLANVKTRIKM